MRLHEPSPVWGASDVEDEEWTPTALEYINRQLEDKSPEDVLKWGIETFDRDLVMATGFGPSGTVLLHMIARLWENPRVFYLETDLLFPETYALRDALEARFGFQFERVHSGISLDKQAEEHGPALWERNPDMCCNMRKVLPLRRYLSDKQAWITGIRRDQSPSRKRTSLVEWDYANSAVKLNPLAQWTEAEVWAYLRIHDLPYNRLHDEGYPSIGCWPCTRAVTDGEDKRGGRWSGKPKLECGIHLQPAVQEADSQA